MQKIIILLILFFLSLSPVFSLEYTQNTLVTEWSPKSVIISPDGEKAYVLNLEACSVTVYDTDSEELLYTLYFPQTYATGWDYERGCSIPSIAEKPVEGDFTGGRYLWISLHNGSAVFVYDTKNNSFLPDTYSHRIKNPRQREIIMNFWKYYFSIPETVEAHIKYSDGASVTVKLLKIPTGETPKVISVSRDEKFVSVANWHGYSVTIIDGEKFKVLATVPVTTIPRGMVFNKDGSKLYVAIMGSNNIEIIDTKTWKVTKYIESVGPGPRDLIIDREGKYIYCSVNSGACVVKIDASKDAVAGSASVGYSPRTIEFSPDEKFIYVSCYDSDLLYVLDREKFQVMETLPVGDDPVGVGVSPNGKVWVANQSGGTVTVFTPVKE